MPHSNVPVKGGMQLPNRTRLSLRLCRSHENYTVQDERGSVMYACKRMLLRNLKTRCEGWD
jgi:hypothetical protein